VKSELHPVTLVLEPLFSSSSLDPEAIAVCQQAVDAYLRENIFFESTDFVETMDTLYGLNDNRTYSILRVQGVAGSTFYLMPSKQGLRFAALHTASRFLKKSGKYQGAVLGAEMKKLCLLTESVVVEVTKTMTYMKRVSTGIKDVVEVEYPSVEKLQLFYECERKIAYASHDDAVAALWEENDVYRCHHCGMYHQGKSPSEDKDTIDENMRLKRFQRVWRYSHNLGEFRHKADNLT
jgi:hypothetical protein